MVLEMAVLQVKPFRGDAFLECFSKAQEIIRQASGYRSHQLQRAVEDPNRYVLLVNWDQLSDHTEGFRKSPAYQEWKALLHPFYEPFPTVEHYQIVFENQS